MPVRCEPYRVLLSAAADQAITDDERAALDEHLEACADCAGYGRQIQVLRRRVRYEVLDDPPDLVPALRARLVDRAGHTRAGRLVPALRARLSSGRPRRTRLRRPVVAAFLVGFIVGALLPGVDMQRPPRVLAEPIPTRVLAAQTELTSLTAGVTVIEHGWHPDVPVRRFTGRLVYRAPESLALTLTDRTGYPDGAWQPNHVSVAASADYWWAQGRAPCPREAQPGCQSPEPRVRALTGREPFDEGTPIPLDLVLPARSFALSAQPEIIGARTVAGRPAVGVAVTAAQVAPLLDGLRSAGDWRDIHPSDRVELWLDEAALAPLRLDVLPGEGDDRELWAARRGYRDPASRAFFTLRLQDVRINAPVAGDTFPAPPADATTRDAGFIQAPLHGAPAPSWIPDGMEVFRSGRVVTGKGPVVDVATWTDSSAWLKIRTTTAWPGGRLFGDLGETVRAVDLGGAGVAYTDERGARIAIHGHGIDALVTGSISAAELRRVAASLGITGRTAPSDWAEASSATLAEAAAALPGLLVPPDPAGFGPPAIRIEGASVTLAYAGAGDRGFLLRQATGQGLSPPLDPDVTGVQVRGTEARFTLRTGELEWVEDGRVMALRSRTLGLTELVALADRLEAR